jgi:hypothetical protein
MCRHFTVGTYIHGANRGRGLIVSREGGRLLVLYPDGYRVVYPVALRRFA